MKKAYFIKLLFTLCVFLELSLVQQIKFIIQKQERLWWIVDAMGLDLELERNKEFVLVERKKSIPGWRRARKKRRI